MQDCRKVELADGPLALGWYPSLMMSPACEPCSNLMIFGKTKTLDPGLRRDGISKIVGLKIVIPAQAGIQRLSLFTHSASH